MNSWPVSSTSNASGEQAALVGACSGVCLTSLRELEMWAQILATAVGIWLMAAPSVLGYEDRARTNDLIVGPIVASFACVAIWEVTRSLRWVNVPIGIWMLIAPWLLGYKSETLIHSSIVGVVMIGLSLVRGRITHQFGGGWTAVWKTKQLPT